MIDEILPYFNRELRYIQDLASEFAERHPEEAAALRISAGSTDDPHVKRLIQAFALLCARIRFKLDDDFPELTDSLLGHLYPHYLAPVPSMAIVRFDPDPDLEGYYEVKPATEIETAPVVGETVPCRYRTCYPVVVRPVTLTDAHLSGLPLEAPNNPAATQRKAVAVLRLTLACTGPNASFGAIAADWERAPTPDLRVYINAARSVASPIYELLFNHTVSIAVARSPRDSEPAILAPSAIRPVGFEPDEGLLPYGPQSFIGYRLLSEYFAFPEKFMFFDVAGLDAGTLAKGGKTLDLFFYLNRSDRELERQIGGSTFVLGCAPVINLFKQRAEPIPLTQTSYEYPVFPSRRRPRAYEVYSIDRVVASERSRTVEMKPFFGIDHGTATAAQGPVQGPAQGSGLGQYGVGGNQGGSERDDLAVGPYWHSMRRQAVGDPTRTDVFLSFVDPDFRPRSSADWIVSVDTTCLNGDLPAQIPFGGGEPHLDLVEGAAGIVGLQCLTPPTPTLRMPRGNGARWRLLSHLMLNHLSLLDTKSGLDANSGAGSGAEALKETLRLYVIRESDATRKTIEAIRSIDHHRGLARVPFQPGNTTGDTICHGIDVTIEFDRGGLPGGSLYLLAAVLERFLGTACSINAFTRLTARATNEEDDVKTWPPRTGDRILL